MIYNHLKLLRRNLWKNRGFTLLNLLGLAIGFAGFILSYQYINRERSYDRWNPNYHQIYLVGLSYQGNHTDQTPPSLAPILTQEFPEIALAGRMMPYPYGTYPIFGKETALVKNAVLADSAAAAIFQVRTQEGRLWSVPSTTDASIVNQKVANILFSPDSLPTPVLPLTLQSLSTYQDFYESFYGISQERERSHLNFDMLLVKRIYDEEEVGNPFTFQTFIQVVPDTDIPALTKKINALYKSRISKHRVVQTSTFAKGDVYLDPLENLHLSPKHGSNTPYFTIWILGILSTIILVLSAINFSNLIIAQADQRAKEIGVKKLFGVSRKEIALHFFMEVFFQSFLAALIAWGLLIVSKDGLQHWFNDDIGRFLVQKEILTQLSIAVVLTTFLAGIYPAWALSKFKLIGLLKGKLASKPSAFGFRNALITFQFVIALTFISGVLVIHSQLNYIRSAERGFEPSQVIHFKGMGMYFPVESSWKIDFRNRLRESGFIQYVSTSTNTPGDHNFPPKMQFSYLDQSNELEYVGADLDYFELLSIPTLEGRSTLSETEFLKDTTSNYVVINERTKEKLGLSDPVGSTITGCGTNFTVIGVVANSKVSGFENEVFPTVYSFKQACAGRYLQDVMIKTVSGKTKEAIEFMKNEWANNKYARQLPLEFEYLDQTYEQLHARQTQLRQVTGGFVILTLVIAAIGMFGMSAYNIALRKKEMGIRKVLGASINELFLHLNIAFLRIFLLANLIAIPLAYYITSKWLNHFAYKVELNAWPFLISGILLLLLIFVTISFQSIKAAIANPVKSLKEE